MQINRKTIRLFPLFSKSLAELKKNDPLRMAGATAFFATFALPAVLMILIQVFGVFFTPRFMSRQLINNLGDLIGKHTASDLHNTLLNVRHLVRNGYEAVFVFLFLIFVATTLLKVIQDSLNQLWNIRIGVKPGFGFSMLNRGKALLVILVAGFLFLMVLLSEAGLDLAYRANPTADHSLLAKSLFRQLVALILICIWFSLVFKFLPDARPKWKTVFAGGIFTGLFFTLGKLILQWLLTYSNMQTIYGASTSSVLLLLFVFYCSFIFYFGACFTKIWADYYDDPIQPAKYAEKYEWSKVRV